VRRFDYSNIPEDLLSHEIMNLVSAIHEYKGKQDLFIEAKPDILQSMLEIAKIQSTGASNRIEGIYTSDERLMLWSSPNPSQETDLSRKLRDIVRS